jgi:Fe-S-cluster containining protein
LTNDISRKQQFLEQLTAALVAGYRARDGQIFCGRGCSSCCTLAVNCTLPEAQLLAEQLDEEQLERVDRYVERIKELSAGVTELKEYLRRHRRDSGGCPLLAGDGACAAYAHRPFSCRALLSTKESRWCGVDFADLTAAEKEEFFASLDRSVTAFPLHYLALARDAGRELERQALLQMAAEYGFSLYGNMGAMVHLVHSHGLTDILAAGAAGIKELLRRTGLDNPLLLQFEEI